MATKCYVGISNKARNVKKMYVGVSDIARKVIKAYVGVNGKARLCFLYKGIIAKGTARTALPTARWNLASANSATKLLFAGGQNGSNNGLPKVDSYNRSLTSATSSTNLSQARRMLAGARAGNYAIFAGRMHDNRK